MFVMISPLQTHLSETLTSLKFATKVSALHLILVRRGVADQGGQVHNTHIGTARRQAKMRDT